LVDYGDLSKLFALNKYYEPSLHLPDYTGLGLAAAEVMILQQEVLKEHSKLVLRMKLEKPKVVWANP